MEVTSIIGNPIVEMTFRGVKDWQIETIGEFSYIFYSNIAFMDGGIIWADACRFDDEILKGSDYVRADSLEWTI